MQKKIDWEKLVRRMELLMRLKSFPVAFKMLEKKEDLKDIPFMRRTKNRVTLCQLITLVRNFDWTVGALRDDFLSPTCSSIIGLSDIPDLYKDGTFRSIVWVKSRKDGKKYELSIPRFNYTNVIFDYHKMLIDSGYFECYNYWLLSQGSITEFENWFLDNTQKYKEFLNWFYKHPMLLDDEHKFVRYDR